MLYILAMFTFQIANSMSMIQFIKDPFPDNHDGFDYAPKSFMESKAELEASSALADQAKAESKMMSLLLNVFN